MKPYTWQIKGPAGAGILHTGGLLFAQTLIRAGFFVFVYSEYPSLIRGGLNTVQITVDTKQVFASAEKIDHLISLDSQLQFEEIAQEFGGDKIMRNVAAVGLSLARFKQKTATKQNLLALAQKALKDIFKKKGEKIIKANQAVLEAGYKSWFNQKAKN